MHVLNVGVCCHKCAPPALHPVAQTVSALQPRDWGGRAGGRGDMQTGFHEGPEDLGSRTLNFPQDKPEAAWWGNRDWRHRAESVTGLQSEAWRRTPQPPRSWVAGGGEAAAATFRAGSGDRLWLLLEGPPGPAAEDPSQRASGAASSLGEDISGTPVCDPGDHLLWVSMVSSTQSPSVPPSGHLAKTHQSLTPVTQSQEEGPLGGHQALSWRCILHTVSCTARTQEVGEATWTPEPPKLGVGQFLSPPQYFLAGKLLHATYYVSGKEKIIARIWQQGF